MPLVPWIYENFYQLISKNELKFKSYLGLKVYYLENDSGIGRMLSFYNSYENFEIETFLSYVEKNYCVFDIGANIGLYAMAAGKKMENTGKVYAFEPVPSNFNVLKKNVTENGLTNCILEEKAVSNIDSEEEMFVDKYSQCMHSLIKNNVPNFDTSFKVQVVTLDAYVAQNNIARIDAIKIDTQGNEYKVLEGAKNLFDSKKIGVVFVEYWKDKLPPEVNMVKFFLKYDYNVSFVDEDKKKLIPYDSPEVAQIRNTNFYNLVCTPRNS